MDPEGPPSGPRGISAFVVTRDLGIEIDCLECQDMFHGWVLLNHLPEVRRAPADIVRVLGG